MSIFSSNRKTVWCGLVNYINSINLFGLLFKQDWRIYPEIKMHLILIPITRHLR